VQFGFDPDNELAGVRLFRVFPSISAKFEISID